MNTAPVYLVAAGAATCVGRDASSSAAAVRAGISGIAQHPYMIDSVGEAMRIAAAPWLDVQLDTFDRLKALLYPAIDQLVDRCARIEGARIALALGLPGPRPGLEADTPGRLLADVAERYPGRFAARASFEGGHAAGLLAIEAACRKLEQGAFDACIVAGVDSYIDPHTLEWLERCEQLHGAGEQNNAWGFIPGEAAGTLLLVSDRMAQRFEDCLLAEILATGTATETKRIKTETVCIGEGLTQAFRAALQSLPRDSKVTDVYCDMNGEPYRADEYGFTCLRTRERFVAASDFVAPADCWGDVGAAGAPLHVALAAIAGAKAYAKGPIALVWASSEEGQRAATLLRVRLGNRDAS